MSASPLERGYGEELRIWQARLIWEWMARMQRRGGLPFLVKRIQTAEDAAIAIDHGVDEGPHPRRGRDKFVFDFWAQRCHHRPWLVSSICAALTTMLIVAMYVTARRLTSRFISSIRPLDRENGI